MSSSPSTGSGDIKHDEGEEKASVPLEATGSPKPSPSDKRTCFTPADISVMAGTSLPLRVADAKKGHALSWANGGTADCPMMIELPRVSITSHPSVSGMMRVHVVPGSDLATFFSKAQATLASVAKGLKSKAAVKDIVRYTKQSDRVSQWELSKFGITGEEDLQGEVNLYAQANGHRNLKATRFVGPVVTSLKDFNNGKDMVATVR